MVPLAHQVLQVLLDLLEPLGHKEFKVNKV
jgi:hypothetical protein